MSDHQHVNEHDEPVLGIEELAEIAAHDERQNFLDVAAIAAMQGMLAKLGPDDDPRNITRAAWDYATELWEERTALREIWAKHGTLL